MRTNIVLIIRTFPSRFTSDDDNKRRTTFSTLGK